jgi:hypothetical protein
MASSVVHYKFRSALVQDSVTFTGDHISLSDLKRAIAKKKGLLKAIDVDFSIANEQTGEGASALPPLALSKHRLRFCSAKPLVTAPRLLPHVCCHPAHTNPLHKSQNTRQRMSSSPRTRR